MTNRKDELHKFDDDDPTRKFLVTLEIEADNEHDADRYAEAIADNAEAHIVSVIPTAAETIGKATLYWYLSKAVATADTDALTEGMNHALDAIEREVPGAVLLAAQPDDWDVS